jgi:4Fe-4S ferredoxin
VHPWAARTIVTPVARQEEGVHPGLDYGLSNPKKVRIMTNFNGNAGEGKVTKPDPNCKFDPGVMVPIIDPMRCEAKGPCIPICPYDVLIIRAVPPEEKAKFRAMWRLKLLVHGGKQAFVLDPDACRGCGLCVKACPEKAIQLQKRLR